MKQKLRILSCLLLVVCFCNQLYSMNHVIHEIIDWKKVISKEYFEQGFSELRPHFLFNERHFSRSSVMDSSIVEWAHFVRLDVDFEHQYVENYTVSRFFPFHVEDWAAHHRLQCVDNDKLCEVCVDFQKFGEFREKLLFDFCCKNEGKTWEDLKDFVKKFWNCDKNSKEFSMLFCKHNESKSGRIDVNELRNEILLGMQARCKIYLQIKRKHLKSAVLSLASFLFEQDKIKNIFSFKVSGCLHSWVQNGVVTGNYSDDEKIDDPFPFFVLYFPLLSIKQDDGVIKYTLRDLITFFEKWEEDEGDDTWVDIVPWGARKIYKGIYCGMCDGWVKDGWRKKYPKFVKKFFTKDGACSRDAEKKLV